MEKNASAQNKPIAKDALNPTNAPVSTVKVTADMKRTAISDDQAATSNEPKRLPPGEARIKPKNLDQEPSLFTSWRKRKAEDDDHRDERYGRACDAVTTRPWPLPYESFVNYQKRQKMAKSGRKDLTERIIEGEWLSWRMDEPDFRPSDDSFYRLDVKKRRIESREKLAKYRKPHGTK